ncbi:MAG: hypothetical protein WC839_04410 [Candidatus Paceibacterota bacterium]
MDLAEQHGLKGRFVVGYIGTHGMAHALEKVLDVAERMLHMKDVRFLFVGGGAGKAKLVGETGKRKLNNVVLVDPQPKERMPEYWSLCDVALVHLNDRAFHAGCAASSLAAASRHSRERQARNVLKVAQEVANGNGRTVGVGELA